MRHFSIKDRGKIKKYLGNLTERVMKDKFTRISTRITKENWDEDLRPAIIL